MTTKRRQSIFDVALELTGNVENAFEIFVDTQIDVPVSTGTVVEIDINSFAIVNKSVVKYYKDNEISPCSNGGALPPPVGVGAWEIAFDFQII